MGADFINVPRAAFAGADPKSVKKIVKLSVFLMLSGSVRPKAACRMLLKYFDYRLQDNIREKFDVFSSLIKYFPFSGFSS